MSENSDAIFTSRATLNQQSRVLSGALGRHGICENGEAPGVTDGEIALGGVRAGSHRGLWPGRIDIFAPFMKVLIMEKDV